MKKSSNSGDGMRAVLAQFNDGLGWRGYRMVPEGTTMDGAIVFAQEHYALFPNDHIRIMQKQDCGSWAAIWWQDGRGKPEHHGAI